jgi:hypothetical protein
VDAGLERVEQVRLVVLNREHEVAAGFEDQPGQGPLRDQGLPLSWIAVIGGVLWALLYNTASKLAKGEEIEIGHGKRRGLQRLTIVIAETVGMNGTLLIGAGLLSLVFGWATMRLVRRLQRAVWQLDPPT